MNKRYVIQYDGHDSGTWITFDSLPEAVETVENHYTPGTVEKSRVTIIERTDRKVWP